MTDIIFPLDRVKTMRQEKEGRIPKAHSKDPCSSTIRNRESTVKVESVDRQTVDSLCASLANVGSFARTRTLKSPRAYSQTLVERVALALALAVYKNLPVVNFVIISLELYR